jgi:Protein of unknown function (DUF2281)
MVTFEIPVKETLIDSLGKEAIEKALKKMLEELDMKVEPRKPVFGSAKGKYKMSEDFDAPLDDFKDYM